MSSSGGLVRKLFTALSDDLLQSVPEGRLGRHYCRGPLLGESMYVILNGMGMNKRRSRRQQEVHEKMQSTSL